MFYLGIDVEKFSHSFCLASSDGEEKTIWQIKY